MAGRPAGALCWLLLILLSLDVCRSCILLLDGWVPLTVDERAKMADIVVVATAVTSHKDLTESSTYSAEFDILRVLKGQAIFEELNNLYGNNYSGNILKAGVGDMGRYQNIFTGDRRTPHRKKRHRKHKRSDRARRLVQFSALYEDHNDRIMTTAKSGSVAKFVGHVTKYGRHNISNFGDRSMCYSEVSENETYILFLTHYDRKLSAKYDDLFGAVENFAEEVEKKILQTLGWDEWSPWLPCSMDCDGGLQRRSRICILDDVTQCQGRYLEERKCNTFTCGDSVDILKTALLPVLPPGVITNQNRTTSFSFDGISRVTAPISELYPRGFPDEISLHTSYKTNYAHDQILLCLYDRKTSNVFSITVGSDVTIRFRNGYDVSDEVIFPINVTDTRWRSLSIGIRNSQIVLYFDCYLKFNGRFNFPSFPYFGKETLVQMGECTHGDSAYVTTFQGSIEQLSMTSHAKDAGLQCDVRNNQDFTTSPDPEPELPTHVPQATPSVSEQSVPLVQWSEWTPCSQSCGSGYRVRRAECTSGGIACDVIYKANLQETRTCKERTCNKKRRCRGRCEHGGKCTKSGRCRCSPGHYGDLCQIISCYPGCHNNGYCMSPDTCTCLHGYTGLRCETPICMTSCQNGGICIKPDVCSCPYGYLAPHCSPICTPGCQHGGTCARYDQCDCLSGHHGHRCQYGTCSIPCQNGGTCLGDNKCSCTSGYHGDRCQHRACTPASRILPYQKSYRQLSSTMESYQCGLWGWQTCVATRYVYRIGYRTHHRMVYKCE